MLFIKVVFVTLEIVKIKNLKKSFGSKQLFYELTLTIFRGITGLLGPNGSGKTTLLKIISGLISPDEGKIEVMGYDIQRNRSKIMPHIAIVLEGSRNLYWRLSGIQNLIYFGGLRGVFGATLQERSEILLKEFDLWKVKDLPTQDYSRGMQQKLALTAAWLSEPDLLILDEPTLALDVQSHKILEKLIAERAERGKSILITGHQHEFLKTICSQFIELNQHINAKY
jgi:ABC-2 type transport system ATP-binding protein